MYVNSNSNEIIIEIWKLSSVFVKFSPLGVFCFSTPFGASFLSPSGIMFSLWLSAKFVLKCFRNFFFSERYFLFQRSLP